MKTSFIFIAIIFGILPSAQGQLAQGQFTLDNAGLYHFTKTVEAKGKTEAELLAKTKRFMKEYTQNFEGTTWEQIKGKNVIEASVQTSTPRMLIMDVTVTITKGRYVYDIKGIEFYYQQTWRQAEIVLGSTRPEFDEIRNGVLQGVSLLCGEIEKGIN